MTERIAKLAKLTLEGKMYPEVQKVEYDRMDMFLSEDIKNSKRIYEYVTAQKPVLTEYSAMTGLLIFDGSVPGDGLTVAGMKNINEMGRNFYLKPIDNLSTYEWQHATANYSKIIRKGVSGLTAEIEASKKEHCEDKKALDFLDALKTTAQAMIDWAHKCSEESRKLAEQTENKEYKDNLLTLSQTLKKIPEYPAESFYEAVLSIYILFCYDPDSLGTLDRTLYEFYLRDLANGTLTRDKAKEYLQELFLMLQAKTAKSSHNFTRGGESHFCVGGYLPNGEDGFNDLSMLIFEAMTELPTYIPQISLRWTKKLPREIFKKILDFERNDSNKRIAFVNDEKKIEGFMKINGFTFEEACGYSTVGCNECAFPGGMVSGTTNTNIMRCMENTFFKRYEDIVTAKSFEEFFEIYSSEMRNDLDEMLYYDDCFNLIRAKDTSYVTSLLFDGCIEKAEPYSHGVVSLAMGGVGLVGITNSIDSLAVVKQFVFDEKITDMKTLADALETNWEGYEDLRLMIKKNGKFFGNNDETSNYVADLFFTAIYEHLKDKKNVFGYHVGIGNLQGYNSHHAIFGANTKASPDGRFNGEMLKFGIGQSGGYDREGLTALLSSVAKCDRNCIMTGSSVTNILLEEQLIKNDDNFEKLIPLLETYFNMGGTHFQLTYVSKEALKQAKKNPDDYKSLRVRVSGFSDYFVRLNDSIQNEIIKRTDYSQI